MNRAFQLKEPDPAVFLETIYSWDEALSVVPEADLDECYRRAYGIRINTEPDNDFPLRAIELLRAWHNLREQRAAEARARPTPRSLEDFVAGVSARAAALRERLPGRYVEPSTPVGIMRTPPPPTVTAPARAEGLRTVAEAAVEVLEQAIDAELVDGTTQFQDDGDLPF